MINILWPTIRPKVAIANAAKWIELATDKNDLEFWFGVNGITDYNALVNSDAMAVPYRFCQFKARQGVTHTATMMCRQMLGFSGREKDIFVLCSDDFDCSPGWDEHLRNQYAFEWDGVLICNDCYKKNTNIIPLPILGGACLRRLNGIVYSPHYSHFFSDQEFFDVATALGIVKNLRETDAPKFKHEHWSFGGRQRDQFDIRNDKMWNDDKATYTRRCALPVEEKLKLPDWWSE